MTAQRVTHLYDLMDSAYDAQSIHEHSRSLGHIPIIDAHPRRDPDQKAELHAEAKRRKLLNFNYAEDVRYRERTTVERVNARLKDEFGGRTIRVRTCPETKVIVAGAGARMRCGSWFRRRCGEVRSLC